MSVFADVARVIKVKSFGSCFAMHTHHTGNVVHFETWLCVCVIVCVVYIYAVLLTQKYTTRQHILRRDRGGDHRTNLRHSVRCNYGCRAAWSNVGQLMATRNNCKHRHRHIHTNFAHCIHRHKFTLHKPTPTCRIPEIGCTCHVRTRCRVRTTSLRHYVLVNAYRMYVCIYIYMHYGHGSRWRIP